MLQASKGKPKTMTSKIVEILKLYSQIYRPPGPTITPPIQTFCALAQLCDFSQSVWLYLCVLNFEEALTLMLVKDRNSTAHIHLSFSLSLSLISFRVANRQTNRFVFFVCESEPSSVGCVQLGRCLNIGPTMCERLPEYITNDYGKREQRESLSCSRAGLKVTFDYYTN